MPCPQSLGSEAGLVRCLHASDRRIERRESWMIKQKLLR
jgi:hypothetical protein